MQFPRPECLYFLQPGPHRPRFPAAREAPASAPFPSNPNPVC